MRPSPSIPKKSKCPTSEAKTVNEESLNMSVRKFLKKVGITAQREIETAVRDAIESGQITGDEALEAQMTLTIGGLSLEHTIDGTIELK